MPKRLTCLAGSVVLVAQWLSPAQASPCSCSHMNAESIAGGTCSKGEDTASLCRMEWNGGSAQQASSASSQGRRPSTGVSEAVAENERRFGRLLQGYDTKLSDRILSALRQHSPSGMRLDPAEVDPTARNIVDPSPSRVAANLINRGLVRDNPSGLAWSVILLAARSYFPFADYEDGPEGLARAIASQASGWTSIFIQEQLEPKRFEIYDEASSIKGTLTVSTDCLDVQIGRVLVVVKGPRSVFARDCGR
jgi:hypothetical protein